MGYIFWVNDGTNFTLKKPFWDLIISPLSAAHELLLGIDVQGSSPDRGLNS